MTAAPDGLRKATLADAKGIQEIINACAAEDLMLPRALSHICENIRDFTVSVHGGEVVGCAALHACWDNLAELRSVAVAAPHRSAGKGDALVRAALAEAVDLAAERIFVLTYIPDFFKRYGFRDVEKTELPHKIWKDCIECVHFGDCHEVPLALETAELAC